jgi:hypothetical protein
MPSGRRDHKVVQVRANSLRPLGPPEAYKTVPRREILQLEPPAQDGRR